MKVAFVMNVRRPITGAELMPIKIMQELTKIDPQTEYFVVLQKAFSMIYEVDSDNFHEIWFPNWLKNPILNILWTQIVLPFLFSHHGIDTVFANYNIIPFWGQQRTILLIHDLADYRISRKYDIWRTIYHRIMLKLGVGKADAIVTVSENTKKDIIEFLGVNPEEGFYSL